MRLKWDNTVKGPHKLFVPVQTHDTVIVRTIASCMVKVASGFPAPETRICSDAGCCAGSQGSQAVFPPSSSLFCNLALLQLGLALNTDCAGSSAWPIWASWDKGLENHYLDPVHHRKELLSSWLLALAFELPHPTPVLTSLCFLCFLSLLPLFMLTNVFFRLCPGLRLAEPSVIYLAHHLVSIRLAPRTCSSNFSRIQDHRAALKERPLGLVQVAEENMAILVPPLKPHRLTHMPTDIHTITHVHCTHIIYIYRDMHKDVTYT